MSFDDETDKSIFTRFDFVFSDSGGNTTKDLIEIDGIEKSSLLRVRERISKAEKSISREKEEDLGWSNVKLSLETAFPWLAGGQMEEVLLALAAWLSRIAEEGGLNLVLH